MRGKKTGAVRTLVRVRRLLKYSYFLKIVVFKIRNIRRLSNIRGKSAEMAYGNIALKGPI
jgi:hypothetical protein